LLVDFATWTVIGLSVDPGTGPTTAEHVALLVLLVGVVAMLIVNPARALLPAHSQDPRAAVQG
jgi:hypothetical protein